MSLGENKIKEINGLENQKYLFYLYLDDNEITELMNLNHLERLFELNLQCNPIKILKGLESLKNLSLLHVDAEYEPEELFERLNKILLRYNSNGYISVSKEELEEIPKLDKIIMLSYLKKGKYIEFAFSILFEPIVIYNVSESGLGNSIFNVCKIGELNFSYEKDLSSWQPI